LKGNNEKSSFSNKFDENNRKNNIKNDIDYYLTYLSPTNKKTTFLKNNISNHDQNNDKDNKLMRMLLKKEKSSNNEFEAFTKDFSSNHTHAKQSLFQQKLGNITKISTGKTYLK